MRLLITTQAVDLDDPVLAFFHGWILECARQFEHVEVICLKEGRHALPQNVSVHSLGKASSRSNLEYQGSTLKRRLGYSLNFCRYAWNLRNNYDTVFVHMNPEHLVLGGFLWRGMRKKTALWYIHPKSSWRLRVGVFFANTVLSASRKSFPFTTPKLVALGHGIDTEFFSPGTSHKPADMLRIMIAARLAPVKRIECIVGAMGALAFDKIPATLDYYGTALARDREYADTIRQLVPAAVPPHVWTWKGNASPAEIRDAYRAHDVHVNATDSGSFDKAVLESMACGCITVASNTALEGVLPQELMFKEGDSKALSHTLTRVAEMSPEKKRMLSAQLRSIAEEKYSLSSLVKNIQRILT